MMSWTWQTMNWFVKLPGLWRFKVHETLQIFTNHHFSCPCPSLIMIYQKCIKAHICTHLDFCKFLGLEEGSVISTPVYIVLHVCSLIIKKIYGDFHHLLGFSVYINIRKNKRKKEEQIFLTYAKVCEHSCLSSLSLARVEIATVFQKQLSVIITLSCLYWKPSEHSQIKVLCGPPDSTIGKEKSFHLSGWRWKSSWQWFWTFGQMLGGGVNIRNVNSTFMYMLLCFYSAFTFLTRKINERI